MTYKPPYPERVPEGGKRAHRALLNVGGKTMVVRGDGAPLTGTFRDRTEDYGGGPIRERDQYQVAAETLIRWCWPGLTVKGYTRLATAAARDERPLPDARQ